jgi:hypothetical protein
MLDAMKVIAQDVDRDAKAAAEALAKKKATIHPGIKLLDDAPAGGGAVGGADPGARATLPPPRRKPCLGCYNTLRAGVIFEPCALHPPRARLFLGFFKPPEVPQVYPGQVEASMHK